MLKQTIVLSAITLALTGCVMAPFDDYDHNDRRYDRQQNDSRYDRNRDNREHRRADWNKNREWNRNKGAENNQNRPNPYWNQNRN